MSSVELTPELLAFVTLRLRHAVSNGRYLTPELLSQSIEEYTERAEAADAVLPQASGQ